MDNTITIMIMEVGMEDMITITAMIMASSLMAVIYVWRVVEVAYFRDPDPEAPRQEAPLMMLVPMYVLVIGCFWFGIDSEFTLGVAREAAEQLLGAGQ